MEIPRLRPWLGRRQFAPLAHADPARFVPPTTEEQLWRRTFPRVFAPGRRPGPLTRALEHVVVVPLAHVTLLNLEYQIYLNHLLHTSGGTWLAHLICIPVNVALLFYALSMHTAHGAALLFVLLASWYLAMAVKLRSGVWAAVVLAALAGLWALGSASASWVAGLDGGVPWYLRPLALIAAVSTLQAYSHLFEEHVPPRANFERRWLPVREFIWGDPRELSLSRRLLRLAWTPLGGLWGALDEWWASAKLLPIYLLELLWMMGYHGEQRDAHRRLALAALASGDPALDWVGVGGGDSVAVLGEPSADDLGLAEVEASEVFAV